MKQEFNLSEKRINNIRMERENKPVIYKEEDVKEFMRLFLDRIQPHYNCKRNKKLCLDEIIYEFRKLAGEKLI
jgi:hypothetical protein